MTLTYNKTGSGKYSFLGNFPYELNQFKIHSKRSWIYEAMIIFSSLLLGFAIILFLINYYDRTILYFLFGVMIVALVSFNCLFFIKLSNYRLHIIFALIFYFSTFLTFVLELLLLTSNTLMIISTPIINIIIGAIGVVFMAIILVNKNYKNWAKMVKIDAQTYNRPKYNYLAILEWGSFLALLLSYIPIIVALF